MLVFYAARPSLISCLGFSLVSTSGFGPQMQQLPTLPPPNKKEKITPK